MSYIAPNSDVYILKGISIDSGYNHTLYWTSAVSQYMRMKNYNKYHLTNQSYQRAGNNKIRVGILADNLYDCNYLMFQNTAFGNKWFYAFINKITYINNSATEIEYAIDYMQTWYFDYELGQCFVEREHSATDEIGDNIVPENLDTGELITVEETKVEFPRMLGGIVLKKPLDGWYDMQGDYSMHFVCQYNPVEASLANPPMGIPNGLCVAYGFPVSADDCRDYWNGYRYNYQLQDYHAYHSDHLTEYPNYYITLGDVLNIISSGYLGEQWSGDDIVGAFIYPSEFNRTANMNTASSAGFRPFTSMKAVNASQRPYRFISARTPATSEFEPRNNKLFTYPYVQLKVSNNRGNEAYFHYEDFSNSEVPAFFWYGYCMSGASMFLVPAGYKGVSRNYEYGLTMGDFAEPVWSADQYARWIQQNRASLATNMISTAVQGSFGMVNAANRGDTAGAVGTEINVATRVFNELAQMQDIKNTPPQVAGQLNNDAMNTALNRTGFHFYSLAIKMEYAQMIDDYFSMFGYATKRVKVPNIRDDNAVKRPHWNYIKTQGCIIHPAAGKGLPSEDEDEIAKIYDRGITFWTEMSEVGNYSLDNSLPEIGG